MLQNSAINLHWYCNKCNVTFSKVLSSISRLEAQHQKLVTEVSDIKNQVTSCNDKYEVVTDKINELDKTIDNKFEDMCQEIEDRDRRRSNLVIFGMPESASENAESRKQYDTTCVSTLLEELDMDPRTAVKDSVIRLGGKISSKNGKNSNAGPRPVKIQMQDPKTCMTVLKRAKHLQNTKTEILQNLSIKRDMTPKERQIRKNLVEEMQQREKRGEKNLRIVNQKIVKTKPKLPDPEPQMSTVGD